jgi:hypothetical protein
MVGEVDQLTQRLLSGLVGYDKDGLVGRAEYREKIAIGIIGQSNEQNRVLTADKATYPQAFGSLRNPLKRGLMPGQIYVPSDGTSNGGVLRQYTPYGGMFWKMYDDLWDYGYDAHIVNCAHGNMSMIEHAAGAIKPWNATTAYFAKRSPLGGGTIGANDFGYKGDIVIKDGKVFRCTTGQLAYIFHDGNFVIPGYTMNKADSWFSIGSQVSGSSEPTWSSAATPGDTITDGGIVWTYEEANTFGYPDGSVTNGNRVANQNNPLHHWDPFGILERLLRMMETVSADRKIVIIQNAQADVSKQQADYQKALQHIAKFFIDRGYVATIGLSCFKTDTAEASTITQYNTLQAARLAALTLFNGSGNVQADGAFVQPGANLYATMGTAISSLLDAGGVHLNGAGAIAAGEDQADALKAWLPRRI